MMDQFEDDEVDYEKLKEWEDVFIDEDEEEDITEDLMKSLIIVILIIRHRHLSWKLKALLLEKQ